MTEQTRKKIGTMFNGIRKRKWFILSLVMFVLVASGLIKFAYAYLTRVLPVQQGIALVQFNSNELVDNLKTRLSYLTSRVHGVRFTVYRVKMRDNLWKIARKNQYSVHTIIGCNPQLKTYQVGVNQKIILPSKPGTLHIIQKGDTFEKIAARYESSASVIKRTNPGVTALVPGEMVFVPERRPDIDLMNDAMRRMYEIRSLFVSPLGGRLSSSFGKRRHPVTGKRSFHGGIDIAVREGTWVGAAADGVVTLASTGVGHYGTAVFIRHSNGYETHYGHLSKIRVRVGQRVKAHQLIAKSGSTGRSTGPHLHFTIKRNGASIDPLVFLW